MFCLQHIQTLQHDNILNPFISKHMIVLLLVAYCRKAMKSFALLLKKLKTILQYLASDQVPLRFLIFGDAHDDHPSSF